MSAADKPKEWQRSYKAEYSESNHDTLWAEVDEVVSARSLTELEDSITGDYNDENPRLHFTPEQRDYLQSELLLQILTELKILRAHLIRFYRDVT